MRRETFAHRFSQMTVVVLSFFGVGCVAPVEGANESEARGAATEAVSGCSDEWCQRELVPAPTLPPDPCARCATPAHEAISLPPEIVLRAPAVRPLPMLAPKFVPPLE
jgi:hypothetical protein